MTGNVLAPAGTTIAPGGSIGTLNVTGNVTVGGTFQIEVAGPQADLLAINGNLTLDFTNANLDLPSSNLYDGSTYTIATSTGILTGEFDPSRVNNLPTGYAVMYNHTPGAGSINLVPVPEPGTLALTGVAAVGFIRGRRRRRATANSQST